MSVQKLISLIVLLIAVLALGLPLVGVSGQAANTAISVTCPNGGTIDNGVAIGVNLRPGVYRITAVGVGGFDPVLAIWESSTETVLNCVDDDAAAASYTGDLPTTGPIPRSNLNAQLVLDFPGTEFGTYYAVVGGFNDSAGEVVVIFEELAVTSADGQGDLAGDPFYIDLTQNVIDSGVPVTAYMISLTNILDPFMSLIYDEGVATIDGVPVVCDDAGNSGRCYGQSFSMNFSFISYTAPNGDVLNLGGYEFDSMLMIDPLLLAEAGLGTAEVRMSSFQQNTVGDYLAAFHLGIAPLTGASGGTTGTTGGTTGGSTGTTGSLTGAATGGTGGTTGGTTTTINPAALPTFTAACTDNAQATRLASLAEGQSVLVTCPANCTSGAIWGTGTYTDDSAVCTAAIHAGALPASGGTFIMTIAPGLREYVGSVNNRITSENWGAWQRSFIPLPPGGASLAPVETSSTSTINAAPSGAARLYMAAGSVARQAAQPTPAPVTGSLTGAASADFTPPDFDGLGRTPDNIRYPLPIGWLVAETVSGTILANSADALAAGAAEPEADLTLLPPGGVVMQVLPLALLEGAPADTPEALLALIVPDAEFIPLGERQSSGFVQLENPAIPAGVIARLYIHDNTSAIVAVLVSSRLNAAGDAAFTDWMGRFFEFFVTGETAVITPAPTAAPTETPTDTVTVSFTLPSGAGLTVPIAATWQTAQLDDGTIAIGSTAGALAAAVDGTGLAAVPPGEIAYLLLPPEAIAARVGPAVSGLRETGQALIAALGAADALEPYIGGRGLIASLRTTLTDGPLAGAQVFYVVRSPADRFAVIALDPRPLAQNIAGTLFAQLTYTPAD